MSQNLVAVFCIVVDNVGVLAGLPCLNIGTREWALARCKSSWAGAIREVVCWKRVTCHMAGCQAKKRAEILTSWVRRPSCGVGVSHAKGWASEKFPPFESSFPPLETQGRQTLSAVMSGNSACTSRTPGVFEKFVQNNICTHFYACPKSEGTCPSSRMLLLYSETIFSCNFTRFLSGKSLFQGECQGAKSFKSSPKIQCLRGISFVVISYQSLSSHADCIAVATIRLRMRMRILTRPENSLANLRHQLSQKKLRIKHCKLIR